MNKIFILLFQFFLISGIHAQTTFHQYFSLSGFDGMLYRCVETPDGGFAAIGKVTDFTTFSDDILIMKTDATGNASWIKRIPFSDSEEFSDLLVNDDGSLVAVGRSFSMTTFISQILVVKFNSDGTRLWGKVYGMNGHSASARNIQKDDAGNLYVLGSVATDGASDDYCIMKLDATGNILSQKTFGTPDSDYPLAFLRKANGDFFICGWDNTFTGENIHLLKINASMNVAWNKLIKGTTKNFAYDMGERSDGKIVLAGRYDDQATSYDILLSAIDDATGDPVWAKSYSAADGSGTYAYGLTIGTGDAITVTGPIESSDNGTFIMKTNASGDISWAYKTGESGSTGMGYGIAGISDGGYLVCGPLSGNNNSIVQLIRTNANGSFPCNNAGYDLTVTSLTLPSESLTVSTGTPSLTSQEIILNETTFNTLSKVCTVTGIEVADEPKASINPNPSHGQFTITVPQLFGASPVTIINSNGIEVYRSSIPENISTSGTSMSIEVDLPAGIYLIKVGEGSKMITGKLMIK